MNTANIINKIRVSLAALLKSILPKSTCDLLANLLRSYTIPAVYHDEQLQHITANTIRYRAAFQTISSSDDTPSTLLFLKKVAQVVAKEASIKAGSSVDLWSHITPHHQEIIGLFQHDLKQAAQYLDRMYTTPLAHGFHQGDYIHKHLHRSRKYRAMSAEFIMDKICGLAEALGAVPIEHLEHGLVSPLGELMSSDPDELLSQIGKKVGFDISAPRFQAGAYGLQTKRGLFLDRDAYSILIAKTVSDMIPDKNAPVCEIGGGGRACLLFMAVRI